ncbi:ABC transporter [Rufibacter radiotolerans]|uniref:ABC transporter n=1 Tax=Rufibacter radiotolerans TaxID=1379910 RepID=A0A0H4VLG6_9BACT|nr:ABC transporter ATP-binding protein [Rufibacter radiotolerans]AKQ46635.1 ABC transporter [Rufibacter radiotolerans]
MGDVAIKVEGLGKKYQLGTIGTGALRGDLSQWWASVRGKGNPYASLENDESSLSKKGDFWALQDINFEIKQGQAVGIMGRNGAGKSTLLKILSRITSPTTGEIRIKGRIASLLEVGTGFHPELTGRENIFLNGAILGMTTREIRSKLDEIISFSGVEQHIDTPVKRYSSGMSVRLAFAVAAHLEPEILIIDEVLAVGDADFQKKCLGKMGEVTGEGRTILFVSHNMQAITNLCPEAIWLQDGRLHAKGDSKQLVSSYLSVSQNKLWCQHWDTLDNAPGNASIKIVSVELIPDLPDPLMPINTSTPITVRFKIYNYCQQLKLTADLLLFTIAGDCVFDVPTQGGIYPEGYIEGECTVPGNFLNDGSYYFSLYFGKDTSKELFYFKNCLAFEVEDCRESMDWYGKWWGWVRPRFPFAMKPVPVGLSASAF